MLVSRYISKADTDDNFTMISIPEPCELSNFDESYSARMNSMEQTSNKESVTGVVNVDGTTSVNNENDASTYSNAKNIPAQSIAIEDNMTTESDSDSNHHSFTISSATHHELYIP